MWTSFTLTSSDPPSILAERLRAALPGKSPYFKGRVGEYDFEVTRRLVWSERTFPVIACGQFVASLDGGTVINIQTRPQTVGLVILLAISGFLISPARNPVGGVADWFAPYFFGGLVAFLWMIWLITQVIEERRCRDQLNRFLSPED